MESGFRFRFSRMVQASFGSCRSRNFSDVIEKAVFEPQKSSSFRSMDSSSPKAQSFRSICKPVSSERTESIASSTDLLLPRRKVSQRCSPFLLQSQPCPPGSPVSPMKKHCELRGCGLEEKIRGSETKNTNTKKKKKTQKRKKKKEIETSVCPFSSSSMESNFGGSWWYRSEDEEDDEMEDETEFFFSSKSLSSDSTLSKSIRRHYRRETRGPGRRRTNRSSNMSLFPLHGKIKDSFAVVKKSRDPYNDFRTSMVEMIVEKQIFSTKDLEQLLQSFLSLNSHHHHRVIVKVFTEIWETLFSDWHS